MVRRGQEDVGRLFIDEIQVHPMTGDSELITVLGKMPLVNGTDKEKRPECIAAIRTFMSFSV
jgi:hypothetical protein